MADNSDATGVMIGGDPSRFIPATSATRGDRPRKQRQRFGAVAISDVDRWGASVPTPAPKATPAARPALSTATRDRRRDLANDRHDLGLTWI